MLSVGMAKEKTNIYTDQFSLSYAPNENKELPKNTNMLIN